MSTLTFRGVKGAPLTNEEVDSNFSKLCEKANNLSDLEDKSEAITNLGAATAQAVEDAELLALAGI